MGIYVEIKCGLVTHGGTGMKIKKIKLENNPFFGTCEFDFTNNQGQIMDNIVLAGENGCGKTQLLNIIYNFSTLPTQGDVTDEKQTFTIVLSHVELQQIDQSVDDRNKLVSPTGELDIVLNFQSQSGYWSRILVNYQSVSEDGTIETKNIDSSHLFGRSPVKSIFKSIFSTVEINYSPKPTSNVTAKEIDEEVATSVRSGNDLASEIQQLLIDIQDNDAHELQAWVSSHVGIAPPETVINRRINRFKNAFAQVFDSLNVSKIVTEAGVKKVYFKKEDNDVDIASLSSGEKQIVFRGAFLLRNQQSTKGSIVLIDEPEISLHPTWQTKIFDYYRSLFTETDATQTSQIFIATHSQYVLRSALENRDKTLIVLLKQVGTNIEVREITAPLVLPAVTSAELNYVAFDIASSDYHIELYGQLQNKIAQVRDNPDCSVKECDTYITQQTDYIPALHRKPSSHVLPNRTINYETLPTYVRNAIDHPNPTRQVTPEELRKSIELLIKLC